MNPAWKSAAWQSVNIQRHISNQFQMLRLTCRSILKRQSHILLRRSFSFGADNFGKVVTNPQYKYQIYISNAHDPYLNLSIEHFLLQKSPADSTILFLYVNSPCVVIGRNQNPWLETNLRKIKTRPAKGFITHEHEPQEVQLVRRRSGGGTVFHDHGNVNYCVICPTANFNRDKHAEMVARVLRNHTPRARVNERHDIVLDQGNFQEGHRPDSVGMRRAGYHREGTNPSPPPLKVSGSAYKLIRLRSLHHGTCLLNSWNIDSISEYLQSPARPFLKARGVESVRSPIGNIFDESGICWKSLNADFQIQIAKAFAKMYNFDGETVPRLLEGGANSRSMPENGFICGYVENDARELAEIGAGIEELKSVDWIYGQTPQFTLSSHPFETDDRERPPLPKELPSARVFLMVRSGKITQSNISISSGPRAELAEADIFRFMLEGKTLHEIQSFKTLLGPAFYPDKPTEITALSSWLDRILGNVVK